MTFNPQPWPVPIAWPRAHIASSLLRKMGALWDSANDFFSNLLNTRDFLPQWDTGQWSAQHAWMHVLADAAIGVSCLVLSTLLAVHLRRQNGMPHSRVMWLLAIFGLASSAVHSLGAAMFWWPDYRLLGLLKACAAMMAILLVITSAPVIPRLLALRSPVELEREIVQRRRTERELRQVHAQLEGVIELRTSELAAKNEEMEQFLNTVSHDLKSPVITCQGLTAMLREDLDAGRIVESRDSIERIDRSVKRMRQLIDALLDLSRIGKIRFTMERVDMPGLLRSIADDLKPRLAQNHVKLIVHADLPAVHGDAHWLTEVFENLIINAIKYGGGNAEPTIMVGCDASETDCRFFVRDNGRGIDPAHHARIFEPFRRLSSDKEGSGMGLAIVARIVKMHGGKVWVESQLGMGATFWISLPPAQSEAEPSTVESSPDSVSGELHAATI